MTKKLWLSGLIMLGLAGCSTMNNTQAGAATGGILGGALGAVAGGMAGRPLAGAAIGAGAGALIGGAAGHEEDRRDQRDVAAAAAYAREHPPMTINQVVQMTQSQISPALIIQQMDTSGSWFNVTPDDVIYMRQQGVSEQVITAMQGRRSPPPYLVRPRREVVVVDPYYAPPPVSVGIGFGYGRRW